MSLQLPSGVYSYKLVINDHAQGRHSNQCHRAMALVNFLVSKYQKSRESIKPSVQQNLNKPPLFGKKVHFFRLLWARISINLHLGNAGSLYTLVRYFKKFLNKNP